VLVAFDLLYLNGYDLRKLPLIARKAQLKKIVDGTGIQCIAPARAALRGAMEGEDIGV
jgi:ATP-dependent DNA ligase